MGLDPYLIIVPVLLGISWEGEGAIPISGAIGGFGLVVGLGIYLIMLGDALRQHILLTLIVWVAAPLAAFQFHLPFYDWLRLKELRTLKAILRTATVVTSSYVLVPVKPTNRFVR